MAKSNAKQDKSLSKEMPIEQIELSELKAKIEKTKDLKSQLDQMIIVEKDWKYFIRNKDWKDLFQLKSVEGKNLEFLTTQFSEIIEDLKNQASTLKDQVEQDAVQKDKFEQLSTLVLVDLHKEFQEKKNDNMLFSVQKILFNRILNWKDISDISKLDEDAKKNIITHVLFSDSWFARKYAQNSNNPYFQKIEYTDMQDQENWRKLHIFYATFEQIYWEKKWKELKQYIKKSCWWYEEFWAYIWDVLDNYQNLFSQVESLGSKWKTAFERWGVLGLMSETLDKTKMTQEQKELRMWVANIWIIVGAVWGAISFIRKTWWKWVAWLVLWNFALNATTWKWLFDAINALMNWWFNEFMSWTSAKTWDNMKQTLELWKDNKELQEKLANTLSLMYIFWDMKLTEIKWYINDWVINISKLKEKFKWDKNKSSLLENENISKILKSWFKNIWFDDLKNLPETDKITLNEYNSKYLNYETQIISNTNEWNYKIINRKDLSSRISQAVMSWKSYIQLEQELISSKILEKKHWVTEAVAWFWAWLTWAVSSVTDAFSWTQDSVEPSLWWKTLSSGPAWQDGFLTPEWMVYGENLTDEIILENMSKLYKEKWIEAFISYFNSLPEERREQVFEKFILSLEEWKRAEFVVELRKNFQSSVENNKQKLLEFYDKNIKENTWAKKLYWEIQKLFVSAAENTQTINEIILKYNQIKADKSSNLDENEKHVLDWQVAKLKYLLNKKIAFDIIDFSRWVIDAQFASKDMKWLDDFRSTFAKDPSKLSKMMDWYVDTDARVYISVCHILEALKIYIETNYGSEENVKNPMEHYYKKMKEEILSWKKLELKSWVIISDKVAPNSERTVSSIWDIFFSPKQEFRLFEEYQDWFEWVWNLKNENAFLASNLDASRRYGEWSWIITNSSRFFEIWESKQLPFETLQIAKINKLNQLGHYDESRAMIVNLLWDKLPDISTQDEKFKAEKQKRYNDMDTKIQSQFKDQLKDRWDDFFMQKFWKPKSAYIAEKSNEMIEDLTMLRLKERQIKDICDKKDFSWYSDFEKQLFQLWWDIYSESWLSPENMDFARSISRMVLEVIAIEIVTMWVWWFVAWAAWAASQLWRAWRVYSWAAKAWEARKVWALAEWTWILWRTWSGIRWIAEWNSALARWVWLTAHSSAFVWLQKWIHWEIIFVDRPVESLFDIWMFGLTIYWLGKTQQFLRGQTIGAQKMFTRGTAQLQWMSKYNPFARLNQASYHIGWRLNSLAEKWRAWYVWVWALNVATETAALKYLGDLEQYLAVKTWMLSQDKFYANQQSDTKEWIRSLGLVVWLRSYGAMSRVVADSTKFETSWSKGETPVQKVELRDQVITAQKEFVSEFPWTRDEIISAIRDSRSNNSAQWLPTWKFEPWAKDYKELYKDLDSKNIHWDARKIEIEKLDARIVDEMLAIRAEYQNEIQSSAPNPQVSPENTRQESTAWIEYRMEKLSWIIFRDNIKNLTDGWKYVISDTLSVIRVWSRYELEVKWTDWVVMQRIVLWWKSDFEKSFKDHYKQYPEKFEALLKSQAQKWLESKLSKPFEVNIWWVKYEMRKSQNWQLEIWQIDGKTRNRVSDVEWFLNKNSDVLDNMVLDNSIALWQKLWLENVKLWKLLDIKFLNTLKEKKWWVLYDWTVKDLLQWFKSAGKELKDKKYISWWQTLLKTLITWKSDPTLSSWIFATLVAWFQLNESTDSVHTDWFLSSYMDYSAIMYPKLLMWLIVWAGDYFDVIDKMVWKKNTTQLYN